MADPKRVVLERVLPAYEELGGVSFAWAQGSVVSGYTAKGDYDVILAWDLENIPVDRSSVVARLDEPDPEHPFVVNHRDINIDRFTIEGQEFNIGHATPQGFRKFHVEPVLQGIAFKEEDILQPVVAVSGFNYGEVLIDRTDEASLIRQLLEPFPPKLREEALRLLQARRSELSTTRALGERGDWIPYFGNMTRIVQSILLALFSSHDVYYPGDKWVIQALERFSIEASSVDVWNEIWKVAASPSDRTTAAQALADLAESRLAARIEG